MKTLDPRIRHEHIARYGATDEIDDYLRTLENLRPLRDDESGQDHHMLARSIWPEYASLKANPWNKLRVSYKIHTALTELQSRFEERLRFALLLTKGKTAEAFLITRRRGGKTQGRKNVESGHLANIRSKAGKMGGRTNAQSGHMERLGKSGVGGRLGGKIGGRKNAESGLLTRIRTFDSCSRGGKRAAELHPNHAREAGRKGICSRWNVGQGKPCVCGQHAAIIEGGR